MQNHLHHSRHFRPLTTASETLSSPTQPQQSIGSPPIGAGQDIASAEAVETCDRIMSRGNSVTIRCTPAHLGAEGNEMADKYATDAAEDKVYAVDRAYLRETAFPQIAGLRTEAKTRVPGSWPPTQACSFSLYFLLCTIFLLSISIFRDSAAQDIREPQSDGRALRVSGEERRSGTGFGVSSKMM